MPSQRAVNVGLTDCYGTVDVRLVLRQDTLYLRLLTSQNLVIDAEFRARSVSQNACHGQGLLGVAGSAAEHGFGAIRDAVQRREAAALIFAVQCQSEGRRGQSSRGLWLCS